MIDDPRAVAAAWPVPRLRRLAALAIELAEAPWALGPADLDACLADGLEEEAVLHAVALGAYFGHLNRIADLVGVPLDYDVRHLPPPADPTAPPLRAAPGRVDGAPAIDLARRPATEAALGAWRAELDGRAGPLVPEERARLATRAAWLLGDAEAPAPPAAPRQRALDELCEDLTLAPWRLVGADLAALRALGLDDRAIFDAGVTISSATAFARIAVALRALGGGTPPPR